MEERGREGGIVEGGGVVVVEGIVSVGVGGEVEGGSGGDGAVGVGQGGESCGGVEGGGGLVVVREGVLVVGWVHCVRLCVVCCRYSIRCT